MSYRYILRYTIDPSFHEADRIEELARFCISSRIEEVMLFFTAEELSLGHPTKEMCEPWIETACKVKKRLGQDDIDLSVIPWTTTYHLSRGRRLFAGQKFTTMVGPQGAKSAICACPLCENWRDYICDLYAEWCRRIQPVTFWIEDDWRLHNHDPELGFGGCFCELHMDLFRRKTGLEVTREQLVEAITGPGKPHPWRGVWLEIWRDSLIEPAREIHRAIKAASPATRIALMSSDPDTHSIEGRDWHALQEAFGFEPNFISRPHLPPYIQQHALMVPPSVTRHTIANLKRPVEIYPELENTRCGRYSKSRQFSLWECLHSVCYGSDGITINEFDMMGNGIATDPIFGKWMAESKNRLSAVTDLKIDDENSQGVDVLFHPDIALFRHCPEPSASSESFDPVYGAKPASSGLALLKENSNIWSKTLFNLGIAHRMTSMPRNDGSPVAVNGQTLRCFNDDEIGLLLKGPLLIDGIAAEILIERGFGAMIGVSGGRWLDLMETAHAYEEIIEDDPAVFGHARPRMNAGRCSEKIFAMNLVDGADIRSQIKRADHSLVCPGMAVFKNAKGGRIAVWTYPMDGRANYFMFFFNKFRRILLQRLLFEICSPETPLAAAKCDAVHIYRAPTGAGLFLAFINPTDDVINEIEFKLGGVRSIKEVQLLTEKGRWQNKAFNTAEHDGLLQLNINQSVGPLNAQFILLRS